MIINENKLNFNKNFLINSNGGDISTDGGLLIIKEFLNKISFSDIAKDTIIFKDERLFCKHQSYDILLQKILMLIAGYDDDVDARHLVNDPIFKAISNNDCVASQSSICRLYKRLTSNLSINSLKKLNFKLLETISDIRPNNNLIIDVDSTYTIAYGKQEGKAYNHHYKNTGFHPLVAFDGMTGDFLGSELRSGNEYTSTGVVEFIKPIVDSFKSKKNINKEEGEEDTRLIVLRGDSGFATPDLYKYLESESAKYLIKLKSNNILKEMADEVVSELSINDFRFDYEERYVYEMEYKAKKWDTSRLVIVESRRPENELLFTHTFIVTSLQLDPEDILRMYKNRGCMENMIKEIKNGFGYDQTKSHSFAVNEVRMQLAGLAYNIVNWLKTTCFSKKEKVMLVANIRHRFIKVACKVVNHARKTIFKLSSSHVYQDNYFSILKRIQEIA